MFASPSPNWLCASPAIAADLRRTTSTATGRVCPSPALRPSARASFFSRLRRLSQLPPIDGKKLAKHGRSHSSLGIPGVGLDRYSRVAIETFNPWSPHQTNLRNYAVTHGSQRKPDRFANKAMLATGGFTDVLM